MKKLRKRCLIVQSDAFYMEFINIAIIKFFKQQYNDGFSTLFDYFRPLIKAIQPPNTAAIPPHANA